MIYDALNRTQSERTFKRPGISTIQLLSLCRCCRPQSKDQGVIILRSKAVKLEVWRENICQLHDESDTQTI